MIRAGRYRAELVSLDGWLGYRVTDVVTGAPLNVQYMPEAKSIRAVRREALAHVQRLDWQTRFPPEAVAS